MLELGLCRCMKDIFCGWFSSFIFLCLNESAFQKTSVQIISTLLSKILIVYPRYLNKLLPGVKIVRVFKIHRHFLGIVLPHYHGFRMGQ